MLQGLGLFALDGVAWLGHRRRMHAFAHLLEGGRLSVQILDTGGLDVRFRLPPGSR